MTKKNIVVSSIIILLLTIIGCTKKDQVDTNAQQQTNQKQATQQERRMDWSQNFDELSFGDVEVGQQVMVLGSEDENKIVTAQQIFVGDGQTDFGQMGRGIFSSGQNVEKNIDGEDQIQVPLGFNSDNPNTAQRPDPSRFQNMSDEERQQFRDQMMARGGGAGGMTRIRTGGQGVVRVSGEILSKDEISLTLKIEEGGSKLVFVSDETVVFKPKQQAE